MRLHFSQNIKQIFGSLCLAAVLLLAVLWGASSGQKQAQSDIIVQTAQNAGQAFKYFYQDQNRYPTALEFQDQNIMLNYLSGFPLPQFITPSCSQTFVYKNSSAAGYNFSFCLPTASSGYQAGWNTLSQ
jgi:hypothetical protein